MRSIIYSTLIIVAIFVFAGCNNSSTKPGSSEEVKSDSDSISDYEETIIHHTLSYYNFDKVRNLSLFFDSIIAKHVTNMDDYFDGDHPDDEIKDCIRQIDRYRRGQQKFFPDRLVAKYISVLGEECARIINHSELVDMTFAEWFMMCAAYYTPDITCLVDTQTPDHKLGFCNFGASYNYNPWWAYKFIKRSKGFEVIRVDGDYVKLTGVYQFDVDKNQKYYLFSNNTTTSEFHQELYMEDSGNIVKIAEINEFPADEPSHDYIYFDKENIIWSRCTLDDDFKVYTPIEGTDRVGLVFDGKDSRFRTLPYQ